MTETSNLGHLAVWILIEVMVTHCRRRFNLLGKAANFRSGIYKCLVVIMGVKIELRLALAKFLANLSFRAL